MSRSKNDIPTMKVTVLLTGATIAALDRAGIEAREKTGAAVSRSSIIAAVIESADLPKVALAIAKGPR